MSARDDYPEAAGPTLKAYITQHALMCDEIDELREVTSVTWPSERLQEMGNQLDRLRSAVRDLLAEWDAVQIDAHCSSIDALRQLVGDHGSEASCCDFDDPCEMHGGSVLPAHRRDTPSLRTHFGFGRCCVRCGVFAEDGEVLDHHPRCDELTELHNPRRVIGCLADPTPHGICGQTIGNGFMIAHMAMCRPNAEAE